MSSTEKPNDALAAPLVRALVQLIRADDLHGTWEKKTDEDLLSPFVIGKEKRRAIPVVGNPSPDRLSRLDQYFSAICHRIEQETGLMASPLVSTSIEGFGRVVLTVGRLVVHTKSLRDVHRFGFDSLEALVAAGERIVTEAVQLVGTYGDAARA